jgi:hypothetical protein
MPRTKSHRRIIDALVFLSVLLAVACAASAAPQRRGKTKTPEPPPSRPDLRPKLVPGDVMRYQIQFQTTTDTSRGAGGIVQDPQGPSQLVVIWDARIRLEVLADDAAAGPKPDQALGGAPPPAAKPQPAAAGAMRLRTIYEQSSATVRSDSPDPEEDAIVFQYAQLQGHSIEFTLGADGRVSDVRGLEGVLSDEKAIGAAQQWMTQLSETGSAPAGGIVAGATWTSEQPADSLPLAGLVWRTAATYLRDEPCPAPAAGAAANPAGEMCALILTQLTLLPSRSKRDATPDEYRQNGLQTAGHWTGSGESLSYISLRSGWVVSSTQSGAEEMDVNVSKGSETVVHYAGKVLTHSELSLLPAEAPAAH